MPPVIKPAPARRASLGRFALLLSAILFVLFIKSFLPDYVHFSNDGPLSVQMSQYARLPEGFIGCWDDLNWLGFNGTVLPFEFTSFIKWGLGPVGYAKFLAPIAILIFGICTWIFLNRLKLTPLACTLGALAAALNGTFMGTACWGVAAQAIGFGMDYLALAMIVSNTAATPRGLRWLRLVLAGFAVGVGVIEGADNGAIFSMFVAVFAVFHSLMEGGPLGVSFLRGVGRVIVIAICAGVLAMQTVVGLIGTQIKGISGMGQETETKEAHWDWATQWSTPKIETLGWVIPGLFGCRMNTPADMPEWLQDFYRGGNYWGKVGRDPAWDRYFRFVSSETFHGGEILKVSFPDTPGAEITKLVGPDGNLVLSPDRTNNIRGMTAKEAETALTPQFAPHPVKIDVLEPNGFMRFSGGGNYMGVLVTLIALWSIVQSFRKNDSVFSLSQKKFIWFWSAAMLISLLLCFGRFAPFYRILYMLPYFSTIRNPCKFSAVFHWAIIVVFSYGIHALSQRYLEIAGGNVSAIDTLKSWWEKKLGGFDRKWLIGSLIAIGLSFLGWLIYANSKEQLVTYLQMVQFDESSARQIAAFSVKQVGWFVLIFLLSAVALAFIFSGAFAGKRARRGGWILGLILVGDLAYADLPYIVHWNYKEKYASNPIIDILREKPYEQRVLNLNLPTIPQMELFNNVYKIEWEQQLFPYYDILTLGIVQMPRAPEVFIAFEGALTPHDTTQLRLMARRWELTSTRYLVGATLTQWPVNRSADGRPISQNFQTLDFLNNGLDAGKGRFRVVTNFDIVAKPGILNPTQYEQLTAVEKPDGAFALYEFTGALPRFKLYNHWQVSTNDAETLRTIASTHFVPQEDVVVAAPFAAPAADSATSPGQVTITHYQPATLTMRAEATGNSVLLFNDRYDPEWKVFVDGKRAELLRCNYIMRGVALTPGTHTVEFRFRPSLTPSYITAAAIVTAILLSLLMLRGEWKTVRQT